MPKLTRYDIQQRLNDVIQLIAKGYSRGDIINELKKKYKIKPRQVDKYLYRIHQMMIEQTKVSMKEAMAEHLNKRDFLYHEAIKEGDKKLALEIDKDKARLRQLYVDRTVVENNQQPVVAVQFVVNGQEDVKMKTVAPGQPKEEEPVIGDKDMTFETIKKQADEKKKDEENKRKVRSWF